MQNPYPTHTRPYDAWHKIKALQLDIDDETLRAIIDELVMNRPTTLPMPA